MHEEVFQGIESDELKGYVVWEPILRTDDVRNARKATTLLPDPRVRHYWSDGHQVEKMFRPPIGLKKGAAWDVYLVYPPGAQWTGTGPPRPSYYMHQLPGLPASRRLDAKALADHIRSATEGG